MISLYVFRTVPLPFEHNSFYHTHHCCHMKHDGTAHQIRTSFAVNFLSNQCFNLTLKHDLLCTRQCMLHFTKKMCQIVKKNVLPTPFLFFTKNSCSWILSCVSSLLVCTPMTCYLGCRRACFYIQNNSYLFKDSVMYRLIFLKEGFNGKFCYLFCLCNVHLAV